MKTAIARAIADAPAVNPIFIGPLLPLLGTDRPLSDAAARALARFPENAAARERLISFAQNAAQPPVMRIGAIRALGAVISRDVSDTLIALLSDPKQPAPIQKRRRRCADRSDRRRRAESRSAALETVAGRQCK